MSAGLAFPNQDISVQLLEWLELNRALEVDKVFLYVLQLQDRTLRALEHHSRELGFLELTDLPLPGDQPNGWDHQYLYFRDKYLSHVRHENIAQNDCFYRHMYEFEYISILDIDELIVPQLDDTSVPEMIGSVQSYCPDHDSINLANYYFLTDYKMNRIRNGVPK